MISFRNRRATLLPSTLTFALLCQAGLASAQSPDGWPFEDKDSNSASQQAPVASAKVGGPAEARRALPARQPSAARLHATSRLASDNRPAAATTTAATAATGTATSDSPVPNTDAVPVAGAIPHAIADVRAICCTATAASCTSDGFAGHRCSAAFRLLREPGQDNARHATELEWRRATAAATDDGLFAAGSTSTAARTGPTAGILRATLAQGHADHAADLGPGLRLRPRCSFNAATRTAPTDAATGIYSIERQRAAADSGSSRTASGPRATCRETLDSDGRFGLKCADRDAHSTFKQASGRRTATDCRQQSGAKIAVALRDAADAESFGNRCG